MAFLLPLSQIVAIPALGSPAMPMKSTQDIAQWIVDKASVQPIDFLLAPQMENGQEALKTTAHFPNVRNRILSFLAIGNDFVLQLSNCLLCTICPKTQKI